MHMIYRSHLCGHSTRINEYSWYLVPWMSSSFGLASVKTPGCCSGTCVWLRQAHIATAVLSFGSLCLLGQTSKVRQTMRTEPERHSKSRGRVKVCRVTGLFLTQRLVELQLCGFLRYVQCARWVSQIFAREFHQPGSTRTGPRVCCIRTAAASNFGMRSSLLPCLSLLLLLLLMLMLMLLLNVLQQETRRDPAALKAPHPLPDSSGAHSQSQR